MSYGIHFPPFPGIYQIGLGTKISVRNGHFTPIDFFYRWSITKDLIDHYIRYLFTLFIFGYNLSTKRYKVYKRIRNKTENPFNPTLYGLYINESPDMWLLGAKKAKG